MYNSTTEKYSWYVDKLIWSSVNEKNNFKIFSFSADNGEKFSVKGNIAEIPNSFITIFWTMKEYRWNQSYDMHSYFVKKPQWILEF